jgi:hypothetical protein
MSLEAKVRKIINSSKCDFTRGLHVVVVSGDLKDSNGIVVRPARIDRGDGLPVVQIISNTPEAIGQAQATSGFIPFVLTENPKNVKPAPKKAE